MPRPSPEPNEEFCAASLEFVRQGVKHLKEVEARESETYHMILDGLSRGEPYAAPVA
jgi:hypothetical protein